MAILHRSDLLKLRAISHEHPTIVHGVTERQEAVAEPAEKLTGQDGHFLPPAARKAPSACESMCRFNDRNNDTMADLLDRYLASEEIISGDTAPEPTGEAFSALLRARMAFIRMPRVQQISFMRRLAEEYARCQMIRETQPHQV